jgi:dolichol-phosphate mannosyltransferase
MDISVIIPIYNEEGNIPLLHERLTKVMQGIGVEYELVFVNDGSVDKSMELIKELNKKDSNIKYIDLSRNFGHQIAVSAAIDKVQGDAVVIIDADLQDPPELIKEMYAKMKEGFEVVYAKRKKRAGESFFKLLTAKVFYRLMSKITNFEIPVDTGDFRIMHRKIVEILRIMPEKSKYLRGQIAWMGFNQTYVEYDRGARHKGETGYPFKKMLSFAIDGITSFSNFPLKLITYFGFIASFIAFIVIIYALYSWYFLDSTNAGWTSTMVSILFIGGVQMIAIGVIGEYLSRMNNNVKNRPLYIIKESNY